MSEHKPIPTLPPEVRQQIDAHLLAAERHHTAGRLEKYEQHLIAIEQLEKAHGLVSFGRAHYYTAARLEWQQREYETLHMRGRKMYDPPT